VRLDLAASVALFWRDEGGERHFYAFPHFYLPEDACQNAKNANIYTGWATTGDLELMAGAEIGFQQVQEDLLKMPTTHDVREMVYDPWQATQIAQAIRDEGLTTVEMRSTAQHLSPPMRDLEAAIAAGRFHHPDNQVLNWCAGNVTVRPDARDNIFPRKDTPDQKIDGVIALLYAMARATLMEDTAHAYETRGFITL
jgi:phage terminase large subunit-like protein